MKSTVLGIRSRISEIRKAVDNKMFLAALSLSLTIPDICGKLEISTGTDKEKYINWFDNHMTSYYPNEIIIEDNDEMGSGKKRALTGKRCYGLRCAVLHSGNEELTKDQMDLDNSREYTVAKFKLVLFDDPEDEILFLNGNSEEKLYEMEFYLNIRKFCERICQAAEDTLSSLPFGANEKVYAIEILKCEGELSAYDNI